MNVLLADKLFTNFNEFNEKTLENSTKVNTLDGSLFVDFYNYKRVWDMSWELLTRADYDIIKALYDDQRTNFMFTRLRVPDLDIDTFVYIEIADRQIRWDNSYITDFSITLTEQSAIS